MHTKQLGVLLNIDFVSWGPGPTQAAYLKEPILQQKSFAHSRKNCLPNCSLSNWKDASLALVKTRFCSKTSVLPKTLF